MSRSVILSYVLGITSGLLVGLFGYMYFSSKPTAPTQSVRQDAGAAPATVTNRVPPAQGQQSAARPMPYQGPRPAQGQQSMPTPAQYYGQSVDF